MEIHGKQTDPVLLHRLSFLLALFLFSTSFLFGADAPARKDGEVIEPVEREVYLMGTTLKITLFEQEEKKAVQDIESLIRVIEEAEDQLSNWRPTSELSRLNQQEVFQPFLLSPSLCELLERIGYWVQRTEGAFDPSVGRLLKAWGIQSAILIPNEKEIQTVLRQTGFGHLRLDVMNCKATKDCNLILDAGAFGKGEALDRALQIAREKKMGPLLLDFGGQVAVWGLPPGAKGWVTSIADPWDRSQLSAVQVRMQSGSLSTSGGSEKDRFLGTRRIGHILDPRTGYPVESFGSVTVWHDDALEADILSTALYVMGPVKGYEWAMKNDVAACFLVAKEDGVLVLRTPALTPLISGL